MKICEVCNKEFNETRCDQRFCCFNCSEINRNNNRRKAPIEFNCVVCGNKFTQKRKDNTTCCSSCSQKLWVKNNPQKNWDRYNSPQARQTKKKWVKNNYAQFRNTQNKSKSKRYKTNLKYRINRLMGNAINKVIKDKNHIHWEKIMNYDIETLINHLKFTLPYNITWEDYLEGGFHIDHIIPLNLYSFNSYTELEFKKCWNYRNLRILPGDENLIKLGTFDMELVKKYNIEDLLPINLEYPI